MSRFDFFKKENKENEDLENNSNLDNLNESESGDVEEFDLNDENFDNEEPISTDKEYIDRNTAFEEESSLMDSLLSDASDLENDLGINSDDDGLSTSLEEENNNDIETPPINNDENLESDNYIEPENDSYIEDEPFREEGEYNGEIEEPYEPPEEDEPFQYNEDEGELDFDDPDNYYNDAEISSRRRSGKSSNLGLKIIVGVVAVAVIVGLAVGIRYLMNNGGKLFNKDNEVEDTTPIETVTPSVEDISNTSNIENTEDETNVSPGIDVESEVKDEVKEDTSEEVSSFLQTFTGYVVDINTKEIYVSDKLTQEQETLLKSDFDSYISDTDETVYITENQYNLLNGITETQEPTNEGPIIIGAEPQATEDTETSSSSEDKYYHAAGSCETRGLIGMHAVKLSELTSEFEACPDCGDTIGSASKNAIDYDYSLNADLATIIYKKFNIDAESLPVWTTIGSKVTISYIQNEETLLNDVIEVSRAKNGVSENSTANEDGNNIDDLDDFRSSDTSIFGSEFDAIVATINDRRRGETQRTGNVLDDELSLSGTATKDSLTAELAIEKCPYLWIQILWKKNKDTPYIPDVEDVAIELQTPAGSLINESNIDSYGKKWVKGKVIHYVLKDPKQGKWKVLFTKNVGDFLGDVTIQALPMTGFLQIKKAAAKYSEGKVKVIWQATGVTDDNCIVQIYARNGNNDILLYAGNTIDDNVRTVDMVDIDAAKIAGNIYDIIIKIQDIDVSSSTPKVVTSKFITDEYIIKNVEVPNL